MNCPEIERQVMAYLDGELSGELERAVSRHLSGCAGCARKLSLLRRTKALLGELEPKAAPAGLELRLHQKLIAPGSKPGVRRHLELFLQKLIPVRPAVAAPAAVAGLALLIVVAAISVALKDERAPDDYVEAYFSGRSPYYEALIDKHEIFEVRGPADGR